tara:strand:- start:11056 stop:11340 length:285 start_codon:yes stop_codon:yes gene_type:complete
MIGLFTPDELGNDLWDVLPEYQSKANCFWLNEIFKVLKVGGVWCWPETARVFKKADNEHFIELDYSNYKTTSYKSFDLKNHFGYVYFNPKEGEE